MLLEPMEQETLHNPNDPREVEYIQFGILSPEEVKLNSVTPGGINSRTILENNVPLYGGLMDPRQGPIDRNAHCGSCSNGITECPGHFGHIELAQPIYHTGFLQNVVKVLRCVCFYCSQLLVNRDSDKVLAIQDKFGHNPRKRLSEMHSICHAVKYCPNDLKENPVDVEPETRCGRRQPNITRKGLDVHVAMQGMVAGVPPEVIVVTPYQLRQILMGISDSDCELLGLNPHFARPEWMILTMLPVMPPPVRPAVHIAGRGPLDRSHDDLTHKLGDIVVANNAVKQLILRGSPDHEVQEAVKMLQYHVATMMDNDLQQLPQALQKSGRPIKSLKDRLKGKEGRLRGNLMGKRVDFSGRTVITPDPNLGINEVGVPKSVAKILTFPEIVAPYNFDRLQALVTRGDNYPGARAVIRNDGMRVDLYSRLANAGVKLELGMKVERHLTDHDIVVFNRQPTLHKMSMMGHRVRILPFSTFRMNLSCTSPYNADFDGDEMNLHVPQSPEVCAEIDQLELVSRQAITPQSSRPVMGIVQDSLLGVCRMTRRDTFVNIQRFMHLMMQMPFFGGLLKRPCILKPVELWSGKQIFSQIIPGQLNMMRTHSTHPDEEDDSEHHYMSVGDTRVIVENSVLLMGILCKRTLGASMGSLVHIVVRELGHEVAAEFYTTIQKVVNAWLEVDGHSIGIADCIADIETYSHIEDNIESAKKRVLSVIAEAKIISNSCTTLNETFENRVNQLLNEARDSTGNLAKRSLKVNNNLKSMVIAGSKGSNINVSQVIACVGQQNVEGKRIPWGFKRRTLPHFHKGDFEPESRGFVENSYLTGLTPAEFYFHAMGGREGLIDTAVKTAETGYIQRRLIKAMESTMVQYDGTVRDSGGNIIQFCYGEDGLCGEAVEFQQLPTQKISDESMTKQFKMDLSVRPKLFKVFTEETVQEIDRNITTTNKYLEDEWTQLCNDRKLLREIFPLGDSRVAMPCNLQRLIANVQKTFKISPQSQSTLLPVYAIERLKEFIDTLVVIPGKGQLARNTNTNATLLFQCLLRSALCARMATERYRFTSEAFDTLLAQIRINFEHAQVYPGEMVGALAAQCIGEPATQMTLNTFHFAGVSAKNVTLGVPRLKEILNVSKCPRSPSMTMFLVGEAAKNGHLARDVISRFEHTKLNDVTSSTRLIYDPDPRRSVIAEDNEFLDCYYELDDEDDDKCSPWVLRLSMNRKRMTDSGLHMEYIAERIHETFGEDLRCIFSDDNVEQPVIRLCTTKVSPTPGEYLNEMEDFNDPDRRIEDHTFIRSLEATVLQDMSLHGVPEIRKVYLHLPIVSSKKRVFINERGEFQEVSEWILETEGTALSYALSDISICRRRTCTNDINEVNAVLGIEAVRKSIEKEINNVLQFYGLYVNYRHLALLCDVMTARGHLMAITRHGINRQQTGTLMRASFEETFNVLLDAATHGERDNLVGVSEKLVVGQFIPYGTGCFDLLTDVGKCRESVKSFNKLLQSACAANACKPPPNWQPPSHGTPDSPLSTPIECYSPDPVVSGSFSPEIFVSPLYKSPKYEPASSVTSASKYADDLGYPNATLPMYRPETTYTTGMPMYSPDSPTYYAFTPIYSPAASAYKSSTPFYNPKTPQYVRQTPMYSPTVPTLSPASPEYSSVPTVPLYTPQTPVYVPSSSALYSPMSQGYLPVKPTYEPAKPKFIPKSDSLYATKSHLLPQYSPTSPTMVNLSTLLTPDSPISYTPSSPQTKIGYSPSSPDSNTGYSPTSPTSVMGYSPTSPPSNISYSPTSPSSAIGYSPTSPTSNMTYSPASPPLNISYSPTSPAYSPTTPSYIQQSPATKSDSPMYFPPASNLGGYSPSSPSMHPIFESLNKRVNSILKPKYSSTPTEPKNKAEYSPASPAFSQFSLSTRSTMYSPQSPTTFSPMSPPLPGKDVEYSPASPAFSDFSVSTPN
ncbi:DNA-directed RNA polymerase II subunit RPB1-like [Scaptodrosophila lebanonensis]|uniref:DNA-directed RNA polymerase subunit n=1 Tax=Drosophila lebanonensis TaxID=7225 RepID=A0A6J2UGY8_DROLE|nr:DNA-directed RNA polymerase II subunit RPB1-like [Scaptodrosophila lebanonensis]